MDLVANLGADLADALEHAHEDGIVHRDIKPANVILDFQGHVWLADFGLAQLLGERSATRTQGIVGTLRYMSPEQCHGNRLHVDNRADIYSLGATLYELLTLHPIHSGASESELFRKVVFSSQHLRDALRHIFRNR